MWEIQDRMMKIIIHNLFMKYGDNEIGPHSFLNLEEFKKMRGVSSHETLLEEVFKIKDEPDETLTPGV